MPFALLGGLTPRVFLARHWQRRPLVVRGAIPDFREPLGVAELFRLASHGEVESRLVRRSAREWRLEHGPFSRATFARMPDSRWTLLVQGVNLVAPGVDRLMRRFAFASYARLDDVMVSYAAPGGGVGPHVDSYDVFLLQGKGRRRWRIARPRPYRLTARAPLKILADFRPEQEWVLETGDLLYLPPGWAHDGTALAPSVTYSIGFRAPTAQELAIAYLQFLEDRVSRKGIYADPGLKPQRHPARLSDDLIERYARLLHGFPVSLSDVREFVGCHLSEPKSHVRFERPTRLPGKQRFVRMTARRGLHLAAATIMLYRGRQFFVNGESVTARHGRALLARLADRRALEPGIFPAEDAAELLYTWYRSGYLDLGEADG
ncbi:MAG: cupin domain-containing protein [Betaproteobacteria bacterium]|jgi:50S ribosomal protein L16 3-hydroxylase|nr:cupin domain-containing protein [Betaproteobacteria bacterium]